jgi:hypothetical protein
MLIPDSSFAFSVFLFLDFDSSPHTCLRVKMMTAAGEDGSGLGWTSPLHHGLDPP